MHAYSAVSRSETVTNCAAALAEGAGTTLTAQGKDGEWRVRAARGGWVAGAARMEGARGTVDGGWARSYTRLGEARAGWMKTL